HSCGLANSWGDSPLAPRYREAGLVAARWMYDPRIRGLHGFAERLGRLPLAFQPGSAWLYGYGLDIAGLVVERVSGQRLGDFLRERVFAPLGMAATGFHVPVERAGHLAGIYAPGEGGLRRIEDGSERLPLAVPFADAGSSGLLSTLEDYGRFADMLAAGGERAGIRVLAPATARLLMAPHAPQAPLLAALEALGRSAPGSVAQALGGVEPTAARRGPGPGGEAARGGARGGRGRRGRHRLLRRAADRPVHGRDDPGDAGGGRLGARRAAADGLRRAAGAGLSRLAGMGGTMAMDDRNRSFAGKVALVTGASSGLGEATALRFARLGAKVVLAARRAGRCEALAHRIREAGGDACHVRADVSRAAEVEAMVQATLDRFGRLDCAVNNAGVAGPMRTPLAEVEEA